MFHSIKSKYNSSSIATKIKTVFLILTFLIILIEATSLGFLVNSILIKSTKENVSNNLSIYSLVINNLQREVEKSSNELMLSINNIKNVSIDDYNYLNTISSILRQKKTIYKALSSITYILNDGDYYSTNSTLEIPLAGNIKDTQIYKVINNSEIESGFLFLDGNNIISSSGDAGQLYYVKTIRSIADLSIKGWIMMEINSTVLAASVDLDESYFSSLLYYNDSIVLSSNKDFRSIEKNQFTQSAYTDNQISTIDINGEDYFLSSLSIDNFTIVILSSVSLFKMTFNRIIINVIIISLLGAIFLLFLINKLSLSISTPIKKFTHHIEQNINTGMIPYYDNNHGSEVDVLIKEFNQMVEVNEKLIYENKIKEDKKREVELALYQSQLKPHFLYNTLDVIIRLIALDRNKMAMRITKDIADFYRIALSKGDEIISVESEINMSIKYLTIQQTRYPDILIFDVKVPTSLNSYLIPKLSLQPLVENAIYHGIKPKRAEGIVRITGYEDSKYYYLQVSDDGVGIREGRLKEIRMESNLKDLSKPYGIVNVSQRLKLYYGDESNMEIESRENLGTKVILKIPKEGKKNV